MVQEDIPLVLSSMERIFSEAFFQEGCHPKNLQMIKIKLSYQEITFDRTKKRPCILKLTTTVLKYETSNLDTL